MSIGTNDILIIDVVKVRRTIKKWPLDSFYTCEFKFINDVTMPSSNKTEDSLP